MYAIVLIILLVFLNVSIDGVWTFIVALKLDLSSRLWLTCNTGLDIQFLDHLLRFQ